MWETDPQRNALALTSINSDAKGNINFTYKSHGPLAGIWAVTAHGLTSGLEKTGYLRLTIYSRGVAAVEIGPNHGNINTSIDVHGYYFYQHEPYSYWATAPDGTVYAGIEDEAADDGSLFFHYFIPAVKPGRWAITVHGLYSTSEAIAYFTYDNP